MKRIVVGSVLMVAVLALMMLSAGGAFAWKGVNEQCIEHIQMQGERGIEGHGSKEGALAPTNCDHAFGGADAG